MVVLVFLYAPLVPPLILSATARYQFRPGHDEPSFTLRWYVEMWSNPILVDSFETSVIVAVIVGVVTPVLALLAAMAVRELKVPRLIIILMLLPLFVPGISMGIATAFFFRELGIPASLLSIIVIHVVWALPFAFLIVLTVMTTFDPGPARGGAYDRRQPLARLLRYRVAPDLPRRGRGGDLLDDHFVQRDHQDHHGAGPYNTVQTYIWSTFKQIGLTPTLSLMGLLIIVTSARPGAERHGRPAGAARDARPA